MHPGFLEGDWQSHKMYLNRGTSKSVTPTKRQTNTALVIPWPFFYLFRSGQRRPSTIGRTLQKVQASHGLPTFHSHSFVCRCHLQSSAEGGQQQAGEAGLVCLFFFLMMFGYASWIPTVVLLLRAAEARSCVLGGTLRFTCCEKK